jgi:hypothetical protein
MSIMVAEAHDGAHIGRPPLGVDIAARDHEIAPRRAAMRRAKASVSKLALPSRWAKTIVFDNDLPGFGLGYIAVGPRSGWRSIA